MYLEKSHINVNELISICSDHIRFPNKDDFINYVCGLVQLDFDEILLNKIATGHGSDLNEKVQNATVKSVIRIADRIWNAIIDFEVDPEELYDERFGIIRLDTDEI